MPSLPLAEKLRPRNLNEFVGQKKLIGPQGIIQKLLKSSQDTAFFPSLIFWGPPGCGKTTLARILAKELGAFFYEFSAVNTSVKEIEKTLASHSSSTDNQLSLDHAPAVVPKIAVPLIFVDEIHRFSKSQQDALLPHVEKGAMVLLGATTENPSFSVITPLLSRCRVIVLERLAEEELAEIITKAAKQVAVSLTDEALQFLLTAANGDARSALNVLQIAIQISENSNLTLTLLEQALQKRSLGFDQKGEEFYNTISAFHKSIRGSDPDATLYWLARMLEAGQDPLYITRRLIRIASEDIGLLAPNALVLAMAAHEACKQIGMPECNLAIAEAAVYMAEAPKSNTLYAAYKEAAADVQTFGNLPVPLHIRNAPTSLMKDLAYGKDYKYHHSPTGEKDPAENYLPEKLKHKEYYSRNNPKKKKE